MSLTPAELRFVRELVHECSATVIGDDKDYLIESRLGRLACELGLESAGELVQRLRAGADRALPTRAVESLLTNETAFFRDVHPFEALRRDVLPALMARRRAEQPIRIWSAACATGQEPYSVAMLVREQLAGVAAARRIEIIASDLSETALARARSGVYSQLEVNRGLPARLLVRFFVRESQAGRQGYRWRIDDSIRRMVEFRRINLAEPWPSLPAIDVVLLRNVMIYLDDATREAAYAQLSRRCLQPDGYLFVGAGEVTSELVARMTRVFSGTTSCCYALAARGAACAHI